MSLIKLNESIACMKSRLFYIYWVSNQSLWFYLNFLFHSLVLQLIGRLDHDTETTALGTEGVVPLAPLHTALSGGSF